MKKAKRSTFRILTPIHLAIVAIVVVSIVLIAISFQYTESPTGEWLSTILLDVGFIMFGLAIAFVIGERLVIEAENHRWQEVDTAVCNRAFRAAATSLAAFVSAPSIRLDVESAHGGRLPSSADFLADYPYALGWTERTLLPVIQRFTETPNDNPTQTLPVLTRPDWNAIRSGIGTASTMTTATVTLALPRDIPELLSALLDLETSLNTLSNSLAGASLGTDQASADELSIALHLVRAVANDAHAVIKAIVAQDD